jgi:hypothetical protein
MVAEQKGSKGRLKFTAPALRDIAATHSNLLLESIP